jgi:organic radical activating enzyme
MSDNTVKISQIFSSIQGEGLKIGERQIFIRFCGCNLSCDYCDTNNDKKHYELKDADILNRLEELNQNNIHNTVTLTGGEPLIHSAFLKILLPKITDMGFKLYLETNATLAKELADIIDNIDIIAVDLKLPSVTKDRVLWDKHEAFLKEAFKKEFFIKCVVSKDMDISEFDKALELTKSLSFDIPFVIQPKTLKGSSRIDISPAQLLDIQERALGSINKVLVIPQAHKMLGVE